MATDDSREVTPHPLSRMGAVSHEALEPGTRLLIIGYGQTPRAEQLTVASTFRDSEGTEWVRATSGRCRTLFEMGVNSANAEGRNDQYATFINDAPKRKALASWLASTGGAAEDSARLIIASHPEDFATHAVVRNGTIVAEFK